jgi:hypothetical protein
MAGIESYRKSIKNRGAYWFNTAPFLIDFRFFEPAINPFLTPIGYKSSDKFSLKGKQRIEKLQLMG